jgi:ketosteroid isomerase-like protein
MSEENVEIVRAAIDAWDRGDWDAALKDAAPDLEIDNTRNLGEWRGVHTGRDQMMRAWERFAEPWQSVHFEAEQLIDAGDQVVSGMTATLRGRDGIEVKSRESWLWTFRDAAGLSE